MTVISAIIDDSLLTQSTIDDLVSRAFNPDGEIKNLTPIQNLLAIDRYQTGHRLTLEERIVESGLIRKLLEDRLSKVQFKTLQLFYQHYQIADLPLVIELFTPFINIVISNARLLPSNCDTQFAALVCLSTAWNINLFRLKQWGPANRYYYATDASRKRRRLNNALEELRKDAMKQADRVLFER